MESTIYKDRDRKFAIIPDYENNIFLMYDCNSEGVINMETEGILREINQETLSKLESFFKIDIVSEKYGIKIINEEEISLQEA